MDARRPIADRLLLRALACALLALAILRPPEIHPWSAAACAILLAAAGVLAWRPAGDGSRLLPVWAAGLLPLAAAAVLWSSCRARARDEAGAALALVLAALLGRALARDTRGREVVAGLLVALAAVVAVRAVLQHHIAYPGELQSLGDAAGSPSPYVLARLRDGRPSGHFSLPAALAGFFALTLPVTLARARADVDRWRRTAVVAAAILQAYALYLTRSIAGLVAVAVSVILALPLAAPRRGRAVLGLVLAACVAIGILFVHARRAEIGSPGGHPLALRAGNWRAAAGMILDHPLFGTGPGSFGTFYPRYMRPGMNETRYAHNSYLQVISGWGIWAAVPLLALVWSVAERLVRARRRRAAELPFLAAGASFLVHNLVDFTAFLPGVSIPAAILIGMGLAPAGDSAASAARTPGAPPGRPAAWRALRAAAAAAAVLVFLLHSLAATRAAVLLERAREAAVEGSVADALAFARRAARARPSDPVPHAFIAEWVMAHGMDDAALRAEGGRAARRAVALDPESAILHYHLSLHLRAAGDAAPAFRELHAAHSLFPLKESYRLPEAVPAERSGP